MLTHSVKTERKSLMYAIPLDLVSVEK